MYNKVLKFLLTEILYNGHLQSLGSVGIVYLSSLIALKRSPTLDLLALTYFVFQFIYIFDRARDLAKDKLTNKQRTTHIQSYVRLIPLILITMLSIVVIGFLLFANIFTLIAAIIVMILGALYPIYFKGLTRYIFMFKNLYVASVHALLVFLPFLYYGVGLQLTSEILVLIIFVLAEALFMQIALDAKDIKGDKKEGLKTFPVLMGARTTLLTEKVLLIVNFFTLTFLSFVNQLGVIFLTTVWSSAALNVVIVYYLSKQKKQAFILSSAKFFFWLCAAVMANIVV